MEFPQSCPSYALVFNAQAVSCEKHLGHAGKCVAYTSDDYNDTPIKLSWKRSR